MQTWKRFLFWATGILFMLTALKGGYDLLRAIGIEARNPLYDDGLYYFAVGRGILHGLKPYVDLFDTKPPGIFYLSAASLFLSGDERPIMLFHAIVIGLIPVLMGIGAYRLLTHKHRAIVPGVAMSVLIGFILSVFVQSHSRGIKPEVFATLACLSYILLLIWNDRPFGKARIGAAAVCLLLATGLKEPFLLILAAVAAILSPSEYRHNFFLPLAIAIVAGVLLLVFLGLFLPYVTIYLPDAVGYYASESGTIWARGFYTYPLLKDLSASPALLALTCLLVWSSTARYAKTYGVRTLHVLLPLIIFFGFATVTIYVITEQMVWRLKAPSAVIVFVVSLTLAMAWIRWVQKGNAPLSVVSRAAGAFLLVFFALGVGGTYSTHYFIMIVPILVALSLLFVKELASSESLRLDHPVMACVTVLLFAITSSQSFSGPQTMNKEPARRLDALLDACAMDRYLMLDPGGAPVWGFTKHSPLGPGFANARMMNFDPKRSFFYDSFWKNVSTAPVIISTNTLKYFRDDLLDIPDGKHLTIDPPACAQPFLPIPGFTPLFSKQ